MIGDMYDNGIPNPLVKKCPNCGGENIAEYIGTGSVKYRCNVCGKEFSYRSCPNCGAQMSYDYIHGTWYCTSCGWYCTSCGCAAQDNIKMSDKTEATKEQNISAESPKFGWICPKCGKVHAPDVKECSNCNWLANINASGRINQSPSTETRPQDVTATMNTQEKCVGICEEGQND